jgi:hypothetical protein
MVHENSGPRGGDMSSRAPVADDAVGDGATGRVPRRCTGAGIGMLRPRFSSTLSTAHMARDHPMPEKMQAVQGGQRRKKK